MMMHFGLSAVPLQHHVSCHHHHHPQPHLGIIPIAAHLHLHPPASTSPSSVHLSASAPHFSKEIFEEFLLKTQESICGQLAVADGSGKEFCTDKWQRGEDPSAGYGITRVLEDGNLMEKAAANISIIHGHLSEARAKAMSARGRNVENGSKYFAGALSLVFHPRNPYIPTFRSDIRYFEVGQIGWFGGGADLTPCYLDVEDAQCFHRFLKQICDQYNSSLYPRSKAACDSYFFLPARKEHRGIGGIFFDDLESFTISTGTKHLSIEDEPVREEILQNRAGVYSFVSNLADGFLPSYLPIIQRKRNLPYGDRERQWQLLRRGRYLEFNLLYDRGVKFGLDGGRIESIMVSAPPLIAWRYNVIPEIGSPEAELLEVLCNPREWT